MSFELSKLKIAPRFRVIANDDDITRKIRERLKSMRLVDEVGVLSDTVEIALADHEPDGALPIPPTGAELKIFLGYDDSTQSMGLFVVDEIELSGYPGEMVIRARAAPFEASKSGKVALQTQKTRSWESGTTIGALVRQIAGEHRLTPTVSASLASIALPHTDQASESDMNLLVRLAARYDAVAKPGGGALVFARRGEATSASGTALPRVTLTPADGSAYRVLSARRESIGTCIAYYRDVSKAERREVVVGEGEPVRRLRHGFKDAATALAAAKAEQSKRARAERTMSYTFPGRPEVGAESLVDMQGFRDGVDGEWLVTRAEHYIGPQGYRTSIEAERPNSDQGVANATGGAIVDRVQAATAIPSQG